MSHGIFISYKHTHKDRAGRIFDYFKFKGLNPFMDEESLRASEDFIKILRKEISDCPYFVCVLSKDGLEDLALPRKESVFYKEVAYANKLKKEMIVILCDEIKNSELMSLPKEIQRLNKIHNYSFAEDNNVQFHTQMDKIYRDIDVSFVRKHIDWQEYASFNSNTFVEARLNMEKQVASLENRFGKEFVQSVVSKVPFNGEYMIKEINMACYAASLLIAPDKTMIDRLAYDYGLMFNIIAALLCDPDFSMRLVTTAPLCDSTKDAIKYEKLGNSALEMNLQSVFLGSYARLHELTQLEPYKTAIENKRFQHTLTDCMLPYAIFQIIYKDGYQKFNHVKIDLYSFGIDSSTERRSMLFFEHDPNDKGNYDFFSNQFKRLLKMSKTRSKELIEKNHKKWIAEWNESNTPTKGKKEKKEKKDKTKNGKKNNSKKTN